MWALLNIYVLIVAEPFDKISRRLKRLTSGVAASWEESEPEKVLGIGKRKKIPTAKLQDATTLKVAKPRKGNWFINCEASISS